MTGLTHQMVALLAALWMVTLYPVHLGPIGGALAFVAAMVGALVPDLDQPTANLWRRLLGGRAIGTIFQHFSGGHRHMTHSLIGMIAIGYGTHWLVQELVNPAYVPAALGIWRAFMVGYVSHSLADTVTDRGVPWLWPLHWDIKIPPGPEQVRVTTDSFVETIVVRGGILVAILFLISRSWPLIVGIFAK